MSDRYNLSKLQLPPAKEQRAQSGNSRAPDSGSRGYDLSRLDLPERIEIPKHSTDGKEATETIYIRDLGKHVRAQVEDALRVSPESAVTALHWQIGTAKGASLMDESTLEHFQKLGSEFAASKPKDRKGYFQKSIVPFLNGLTAGKRR